jgi:hypothetical protein
MRRQCSHLRCAGVRKPSANRWRYANGPDRAPPALIWKAPMKRAPLASAHPPRRDGAVSFQPFFSILGKFWTVVHAIEEKFCMHTQTDEFTDVSQKFFQFRIFKMFYLLNENLDLRSAFTNKSVSTRSSKLAFMLICFEKLFFGLIVINPLCLNNQPFRT